MVARRKLKLPSRARQKRRVARAKQTFFFAVFLAGIFAFFIFLFREPSLRVSAIEVAGAEAVSEEAIRGAVRESLAGSYFGLVPKESIIFYPERAIERELERRFLRLSRVEVSTRNLRTIRIGVAERRPAHLWCGSVREVVTTECFFLDETGYAFDRSATFSGSALTRLYGELEGAGETALGKRFLPEAEFAELNLFVKAVEALGLSPVSLVKKGGGDYDLHLKDGGKLVFALKDGAEKAASNLESALGVDPLKNDMAAKRDRLEYIDLRFGNKVFFKFR